MFRRKYLYLISILLGCATVFYFLYKRVSQIAPPSCWSFQIDPQFDPQSQTIRKSNLDIRVFFGYKDTRPARFVADRYEAQLFAQAIQSACQGQRRDCGFQLDPQNSREELEIYIKNLVDPAGQNRRVTVSIQTSSVGPDDEANRKNPYQKWKSQLILESFAEALTRADVLFYNGHSRAGGGPDFMPPKLLANKHIDYNWYKKKKLGLKTITECLKANSQSQLQLLGLFSCQSEQLFSKQIQKSKAGLKVIDSRILLYFSDAINQSLDALSNLQELKCSTSTALLREQI